MNEAIRSSLAEYPEAQKMIELALERCADPSFDAMLESIVPTMFADKHLVPIAGGDGFRVNGEVRWTEDDMIKRLRAPIARQCLKRMHLMAQDAHAVFETAGWLAMSIYEMVGRKNASSPALQFYVGALSRFLKRHNEGISVDSTTEAKELALEIGWMHNLIGCLVGDTDRGNDPNLRDLMVSAYQWARSGFPRVRLEAKSAASHCFTKLSGDVLTDVRLPWDGFVVEIPQGLVKYTNELELCGADDADLIASCYPPEGWITEAMFARVPGLISRDEFHCILNAGGAIIASMRHNLSDLFLNSELEGRVLTARAREKGPSSMRYEESDEGAIERVNRIVASMCVRLMGGFSDPIGLRPHGKSKPISKHRPRVPGKSFIFADDVEIDLTKEARETAGHRRVDWSSRWVTRGHYRNQPVGEGRQQIKRTWVRPHWKGRADAPVRVRDYTGV